MKIINITIMMYKLSTSFSTSGKIYKFKYSQHTYIYDHSLYWLGIRSGGIKPVFLDPDPNVQTSIPPSVIYILLYLFYWIS